MNRKATFIISLALSIAAHAGLIVPSLALAFTLRSTTVEPSFDVEPLVLIHLPPEQPEVQLGIDSKTNSVDRKTWLGYQAHELQLAALAEIEQAAFTERPVNPSRVGEGEIPAHQPVLSAAQVDHPPDFSPREQPAGQSEPNQQANAAPLQNFIDLVRHLDWKSELVAGNPPMPTTQPASPASHESPSSAEQPAAFAKAQDSSAAAEPEIGALSDKHSQATSLIEVPPDQWRLGKPLAVEGLEIKPRKPEFTLLTLITAAPSNPWCDIFFDRTGIPVHAAIVRTTGDKRVDDAVLASLYRWRASGQRLNELGPDETVRVPMQLLFRSRR